MLVELAIGDAYGAGFEYANEMVACCNDLSRYVQHPMHKEILPGMYTDDTQMSIAIAELIVSGVEWTPINIADKFVECFKRDEHTGYAGRFYHFLKATHSGADFLRNIRPESEKSGAAMRAGAIGVFPEISDVLEKAEIQAKLTHDTPKGIKAAQAAALMTHYFIYDVGVKAHLGVWLQKNIHGKMQWNNDYHGEVKSKGWMSVRAAITAIKRNDSMSALLKDCVAFTGDVDTVATIALAAAAHSKEITQDLPEYLIDLLENGTYGRDYLIDLNTQLMELTP